ncbi:LOW QUALITY PROTEIN: syntaxin 17 [Aphomia sociella]
MEEENQLPLKRVELSLSKFNEVAIPHHLDLLRQHKANIIKYQESGEYSRVRGEQRARRAAAQLRSLLGELDALRGRVRHADRARFDRLTQRARDLTLRAVVDYLGIIESSCRTLVAASRVRSRTETPPLTINRPLESESECERERAVCGSATSTESVGVLELDPPPPPPPLQLQLQLGEQTHEDALREREAVLRGWSELQAEVRALHDAWQHVQAAALAQRDHVTHAEASVQRAAADVHAATKQLSVAERLSVGAYGAGGAVAGAMLGGPLGLVLGAKVGAAAAAGGAAGYLGARLVGVKRRGQLDDKQD